MTKKKNTQEDRRKLGKQELRTLKKILTKMRKQVREERKLGPDIIEKIAEQLADSVLVLEACRKKIASAKAHCKKRKQEIDEWKIWYNNLAEIDKSESFKQLEKEISWRAQDIATKENEIVNLYADLLLAEGNHEAIKLRQTALESGIWEGPIDQEPRVNQVLEEITRIERKLSKLSSS